MSRYHAIEDPRWCIGTSILVIKAGVRNQDELDQFEQLMFLKRSEKPHPDGALGSDHWVSVSVRVKSTLRV